MNVIKLRSKYRTSLLVDEAPLSAILCGSHALAETIQPLKLWINQELAERFRRSVGTKSWDRALRRIQILKAGGELAPAMSQSRNVALTADAFLEDCRARNLKGSTTDQLLNHARPLQDGARDQGTDRDRHGHVGPLSHGGAEGH